ncbi:hypothetical protein Y032_0245g3547 [Ancylostoma ceylanicum]|uniref:Uncharacterized protein n=1 Tax=Ancylostoma ceylanicum TaxID=53326 RepID=A0A016SDT4_9BILA|nr:hypothetical protein Y032_0245g3547 [Ancylostoma ceylanicum]
MEENFTWWSITETSAEFWEPLMLQMIFLIPSFFGTFILVLFLLAHVANLEKYMPKTTHGNHSTDSRVRCGLPPGLTLTGSNPPKI